jgi:hypothetical protein
VRNCSGRGWIRFRLSCSWLQPVQRLATFCLHSDQRYIKLPLCCWFRKFASASLVAIASVLVPSPGQNKFCFPYLRENPPYPGKLVSIVALS